MDFPRAILLIAALGLSSGSSGLVWANPKFSGSRMWFGIAQVSSPWNNSLYTASALVWREMWAASMWHNQNDTSQLNSFCGLSLEYILYFSLKTALTTLNGVFVLYLWLQCFWICISLEHYLFIHFWLSIINLNSLSVDVGGGNLSAWWKATWAQGKRANSTQKGPVRPWSQTLDHLAVRKQC